MASFIIHDIAGEEFIKALNDKLGISLSKEQINKFLLGNLIPDSIENNSINNIQKDKHKSHFRATDDFNLCIQSPVLDIFLKKYKHLFPKDLSVLGYFFHLFTDYEFFSNLFPKTFICLDSSNKPTIYNNEVSLIKVLKNNKEYAVTDFFNPKSPTSIYKDYTKINTLILNKYHPLFDLNSLKSSINTFINPGIEEVNYNNIEEVLDKTASFINESYNLKDQSLIIFDSDMIINFIPNVVSNFINKYQDLITISLST